MSQARHLVVGRLRKPHGLKGDVTLFPLTDDPAAVFAPGRPVWLVGLDGEEVAGPLTIERSRTYHREWLVKFEGADGREALCQLRGLGRPGLIVLDPLMPRPDGWELIRRHRRDPNLAGIPLIVVSAAATSGWLADDEGVVAQFGKPTAAGKLLEAIGRYLPA